MRSISAADRLRRAEFHLSVEKPEQLPPDDGVEVAFAGRSNAGKSSALNAIADQRGLARVSKTPGRTRLINFFTVEHGKSLVDLPGYGYAAVSAETRAGWDRLLGIYLEQRESLRGVILIMDCRHPLTEHDFAMLEFCAETGRPVHVLLSKADKLSRNDRIKTLRRVERELAALSPDFSVQLFSATSREGLEAAQDRIAEWLGIEKSRPKKSPGDKGRKSGAFK